MKLNPVKSTSIAAVGYDATKREMRVKFHSGGEYSYHGVSQQHHDDFVSAKSIGAHFGKHVNGKFRHTKH